MSALPKAVQKQIAEANKLAERIKKGEAADGSTPPEPNAPPATPPAAAAPPTQPPAPAASPPPEDSWEKRYRVLQGKYNAEVPRLQTQLRDQQSQLQSMQSSLTTTQALLTALGRQQGSAPVSAPAAASPAVPARLVKDEEVKTFGADLYDFIKRAAQEVMPTPAPSAQPAPQVVQQVQWVEQQVQDLNKKVAESDQQKMMALLADQVPDWEKLNEDADFLAWLDQHDPYSGVKRQDLFDQAAARFDGPRIVAFFKGFQTEHAVVQPPSQPTPPAQPAASNAAPVAAPVGTPAALERFIAPGAARAGATGAPNEAQKRIYSRAEIEDFTRRKNSFVIKGRKVPDSIVAEEKEIFKAASEGRVSA